MSTASVSTPAEAARLQLFGVLFAVAGAALFSTKGIIVKLALAEGIDTVTTLAWRMIVAIPVFGTLGVLSYLRDRRRRSAAAEAPLPAGLFPRVLTVGVLGYYVSSYLDFSALEFISAQLDRLILLTYPFFVVLFGALFFGRRITRAMVAALLVSYGGIAVIFWHDLSAEGDAVWIGSLLVLGSAVTYATYQILAKPLIDRMGAPLFTSVAMCGAGPLVIGQFFVTHPVADLAVTGYELGLMVSIGLMSTVLPAYCISAALGMVGPERTAVIGNVSPVFTVILAVLILGEAFTPFHAAGTALVLFGVWLFARRRA